MLAECEKFPQRSNNLWAAEGGGPEPAPMQASSIWTQYILESFTLLMFTKGIENHPRKAEWFPRIWGKSKACISMIKEEEKWWRTLLCEQPISRNSWGVLWAEPDSSFLSSTEDLERRIHMFKWLFCSLMLAFRVIRTPVRNIVLCPGN